MAKKLRFDVQHTAPIRVKRALAIVYPNPNKRIRKMQVKKEGEVYFILSQDPTNKVTLTDKSISQYTQMCDGVVPSGTQGKYSEMLKIKKSMHKVRKAKKATMVARDPANPDCLECVICPVFAKTGGCKHTLAAVHMNEQSKPLENRKKRFNLKYMCRALGKNTRKKGRLAKTTPALVPQPKKGAVQERGGALAMALEQAKGPDPATRAGMQTLGLQTGKFNLYTKSTKLKERQATQKSVLALHAATNKEIAKEQVNSM